MAKKKAEEKVELPEVLEAGNVTVHLDRDPNDPRNVNKDNSAEQAVDITVPRK